MQHAGFRKADALVRDRLHEVIGEELMKLKDSEDSYVRITVDSLLVGVGIGYWEEVAELIDLR